MAIRHNWGADQVYYRVEDGRLRTMPIAWTSLISEDPAIKIGNGLAPFALRDLIELIKLVDGLRQAHTAGNMTTGSSANEGGGGQHV